MNLGQQFDRFPSAPRYSGYWNDWDTDEEINEYTWAALASGTQAVRDDTQHGVVRISGAATTNNSGGEMYRDASNVALALGKRTKTIFRIKASDATNSKIKLGVGTAGGGFMATDPANGFWFYKANGAALFDCYVQASSAPILVAAGAFTLVDATYCDLAIELAMDAATANRGTVTFSKDGSSSSSAVATLSGLPTAILACFFGFMSGNASGTKYMDVDLNGVYQER